MTSTMKSPPGLSVVRTSTLPGGSTSRGGTGAVPCEDGDDGETCASAAEAPGTSAAAPVTAALFKKSRRFTESCLSDMGRFSAARLLACFNKPSIYSNQTAVWFHGVVHSLRLSAPDKRHARGRNRRDQGGHRGSPEHLPHRCTLCNQLPAEDGTDNRPDAADAERPSNPGGPDSRRIKLRSQRVGAVLPADDSQPGARYRQGQQGNRRARRTNEIDAQRRPQVTRGQDSKRKVAIEHSAQDERAANPTHLKQRRQQDGRAHRDAGVADDGRQPAVQEIEVEEIHEVHDPDQRGRQRPAFREQLLDEKDGASPTLISARRHCQRHDDIRCDPGQVLSDSLFFSSLDDEEAD